MVYYLRMKEQIKSKEHTEAQPSDVRSGGVDSTDLDQTSLAIVLPDAGGEVIWFTGAFPPWEL